MREERDLYNEKLELTGKTYFKGDNIPINYFPMVVMIAIQNFNGEFLMQKRVQKKGGNWGVTGGHPKSGETPYEGIITEVKEELSLDISNQKIIEFNSGCDGDECYKMYYVHIDININSLNIQKEELTEIKWFSIEELNKMEKLKILTYDQVAFFHKCKEFLNTIK